MLVDQAPVFLLKFCGCTADDKEERLSAHRYSCSKCSNQPVYRQMVSDDFGQSKKGDYLKLLVSISGCF